MRRLVQGTALAVVAAFVFAACGSKTPTSPTPGNGGNGGQTGSPNTPPVIDTIAVQGSRAKEPANFADVGEGVQVTATVHDAETPVNQLQYQWSAPAGTFTGSGAAVTWTAPASVPDGSSVILTLKVVESYGSGASAGQNTVTGTATVLVHDSIKEVGDMSRQFLIDFSDTNDTNADYIMRNFSKARCPQPGEVDSEREDVVKNYTKFIMQDFRIGAASVTVTFGGSCPVVPGHGPKLGDACAIVPSYWDSILRDDNQRRAVDGNDIIAAAFSSGDNRWWLCASDYDAHQVSGPPFPFGMRFTR